jgi:hypothetical protein
MKIVILEDGDLEARFESEPEDGNIFDFVQILKRIRSEVFLRRSQIRSGEVSYVRC